MGFLSLLVSFLVIVKIIKDGVVVGPLSLCSFYSFASLVVFFINDHQLVYFEPYWGIPLPMYGDHEFSNTVYSFSLALSVSFLIISVIAKKVEADDRGGLISFDSFKASKVTLLSGYCLVCMLSFLYLFHVLEVDYSVINNNFSYLYNVSPLNVSAESPFAIVAHHLTGPGGIIMSFFVVYFIQQKKYVFFIIALVVLLYMLFIKASQLSRWLPLIVMCLGVSCFALLKGGKRRWGLSVLFAFLSLFLFVLVLKGRGDYQQGFVGFIKQISDFGFDDFSYAFKLLVNVLGGYIVFAEALDVGWDYSFGYVVRSFSPFPSFVDGWLLYVGDVGRINRYSPFNVFAELYFFGVWKSFLVYVVFGFFLYRFEVVNRKFFSVMTIMSLVLFIYVVFAAYFYPVRNVFRVFLVCVIFYELSRYYGVRLRGDE